MKSTDLRVTNLVTNDGVIAPIAMIGIDSVQLFTPQGNVIQARLELIKPIPLAEEWLVRFDFMPTGKKSTYWRKANIQLMKDSETGYFEPVFNRLSGIDGSEYYIFSPDHNGSNVFIKYVHELQNFFWANTKEELPVKILKQR